MAQIPYGVEISPDTMRSLWSTYYPKKKAAKGAIEATAHAWTLFSLSAYQSIPSLIEREEVLSDGGKTFLVILRRMLHGREMHLAEAVLGTDRNDPRRKEWGRVSKSWGLGSLRALEGAGVITRGQRSRIGTINDTEALRIIGGIYLIATRAGGATEFDRWILDRMLYIDGSDLKNPNSESVIATKRSIARDEAYRLMDALTLEEVEAVKTIVESMAGEHLKDRKC